MITCWNGVNVWTLHSLSISALELLAEAIGMVGVSPLLRSTSARELSQGIYPTKSLPTTRYRLRWQPCQGPRRPCTVPLLTRTRTTQTICKLAVPRKPTLITHTPLPSTLLNPHPRPSWTPARPRSSRRATPPSSCSRAWWRSRRCGKVPACAKVHGLPAFVFLKDTRKSGGLGWAIPAGLTCFNVAASCFLPLTR